MIFNVIFIIAKIKPIKITPIMATGESINLVMLYTHIETADATNAEKILGYLNANSFKV